MPDGTPLDRALEEALQQVRADPGLRELLRAARSWGVPPSRMLGRRTAGLVIERDEAGRQVRHMIPPWPLADVALALALEQFDAETCSGCGHPLSETTDPRNEGRYRTDLPVRCHACTALAYGAEPYQQNPHPHALRFGVRLRPAVPDSALPPLDAEVTP
jgi:hypothetical protein